jgi:NAD(P)-dependent dehydrogenase (short-subunit alcohol dehydrogenase family)
LNDYGRLDILINNAAVHLEGEPPSQTLMSKMRETFETNFFGVFAVTKAFFPLLQKSDKARIVNVSSQMASFEKPFPNRNRLAYSTSKTALNMMTVQFDREFRTQSWNIKINSVNPGKC